MSLSSSNERGELGTLLPVIKVDPPGPKSKAVAEVINRFESAETYPLGPGTVPIAWKMARGSNIVDADDNVYIDTSAAFGVSIAGHSHPKIVAAIRAQVGELMHAPGGMSPNIKRAELLQMLSELLPADLKKIHIGSIGSEAMDIAIKLAQIHTGSSQFIAFEGAFHGETHGALSLTSRNHYRKGFFPLVPNAIHVPYAYCYRCAFGLEYPDCNLLCTKYLEHVLSDPASGVGDVAAIAVELIEGHEGYVVPPNEFIPNIRRLCNDYNLLMIADEIITGFGRTGKLFCFQHYDVLPDILVCGKGIASGFPISATISRSKVAASWESLKHTSTFLANPLGCAAALACLNAVRKEELVERSEKLGTHLLKRLQELMRKHSVVGDVRGKGLMIGVELVDDQETKAPAAKSAERIVERMLKRGVYCACGGRFGNVLKFSPPLVITIEQLDFCVDMLDKSFCEVEKSK